MCLKIPHRVKLWLHNVINSLKIYWHTTHLIYLFIIEHCYKNYQFYELIYYNKKKKTEKKGKKKKREKKKTKKTPN